MLDVVVESTIALNYFQHWDENIVYSCMKMKILTTENFLSSITYFFLIGKLKCQKLEKKILLKK